MACCGVIKLSTLKKHNRWDAGYYLGDPSLQKELDMAKEQTKQARARVAKRRRAVMRIRSRLLLCKQVVK